MGIISGFFFEASRIICFLVRPQYYYDLSPNTTNLYLDTCYGHSPDSIQDIIDKMMLMDKKMTQLNPKNSDGYVLSDVKQIENYVNDISLYFMIQFVGKDIDYKWCHYYFIDMVIDKNIEVLDKIYPCDGFIIVFLKQETDYEIFKKIISTNDLFTICGEIDFMSLQFFCVKFDELMLQMQNIREQQRTVKQIALEKKIELETIQNEIRKFTAYRTFITEMIKKLKWKSSVVQYCKRNIKRTRETVLAAAKYIILNLKCDRSEIKYHPTLYCLGVVQFFNQKLMKSNITSNNMCSRLYDGFVNEYLKSNLSDNIIPIEDIKMIVDFYLTPSQYEYIFEMQMNCILLLYCCRYSENGSFSLIPTDVIRMIAQIIFFR
jgi:hypothetical protein